MNNDLFVSYSWYFRNALVRANYEDLSKGIFKSEKYLHRFLSNLLLSTNYELKNREMHVLFDDTQNDTENLVNDTVNDTVKFYHVSLISLIKRNRNITANEISKELNQSLSTVKRKIKVLKEQGKIKRIGSDKNGFWEIVE